MARTSAKPANAKPMAKSAGAWARSVEPSARTASARAMEPKPRTANAKPVAGSNATTGIKSRLATASSKHSTAVYWRTACNAAAICTISAMGTRSINATANATANTAANTAANARQLSTSTNATKTT